MQRGVLQIASPAQVTERERQESASRNIKREQALSALGSHIRRAWETNRNHKNGAGITRRLLTCKRQRQSVYEPDQLKDIQETGGSEIFMPLTATKCRAAKSWVADIMMPAQDKAWGIESTPVPDLPPSFKAAIEQQVFAELQAQQQQGEQVTPEMRDKRIEELNLAINDEIERRMKKANEGMENLIEDQMAEGDWIDSLDEFLEDFVTFPTAIMKGPIPKRKPVLKWGEGHAPVKSFEIGYQFSRVSPFDVYPSPGATCPEDGDFIEHVRFYPSELYSVIGTPGYSSEAIRRVLQYGRMGQLTGWLMEEHERNLLENKSTLYKEEIDALHYWGKVQGVALLEWGINPQSVEDPLAYYDVDAILIGNEVVRAVINRDPLARRPYYASSFEKVAGSFWGTCPPELMAGIQRMCNASARALANNMGLSSGPQIDVNVGRLADGEEIGDIRPFRVWQTVSDPEGNSRADSAVKFFQAQSNAQELLAVYERFERMADDATNIPRYSYGNENVGGAGQTASGLSMLMESANKGIKSAIRNIDKDVVRKSVERLWFTNMLYHDDPSVKADIKVVARGATVLIAKDQAMARRAEMLHATNNPIDMQIIGLEGRAEMLRALFKAADMPESIIPSKEKLMQQMKAQQEQKPIEVMKLEQDAAEVQAKLEQDEVESIRDAETDIAVAQIRSQGRAYAGQ